MSDDVLAEQVTYYRRRAGEYDATAYGDVAAAGARIARLVAVGKDFVDPPELTERLRRLGRQCTVERDGTDWILGQARP